MKEFPRLRTLIGESKGEYEQRMESYSLQMEKDLTSGKDLETENDENGGLHSEFKYHVPVCNCIFHPIPAQVIMIGKI